MGDERSLLERRYDEDRSFHVVGARADAAGCSQR
jgi:hypothetical protein